MMTRLKWLTKSMVKTVVCGGHDAAWTMMTFAACHDLYNLPKAVALGAVMNKWLIGWQYLMVTELLQAAAVTAS